MATPLNRRASGVVLVAAILVAGAAHAAGKSSLRPVSSLRPASSLRPVSARPQVGKASFYGPHMAGRKTASGTKLQPSKLTAASKTLPLGSKAEVTNLANGKSVAVTVTDRGPHVRHRILDVSTKAATRLGMKHDGVAVVKVQPLTVPKTGR